MKQCPKCRNTYPDEVEFCMHEGERLVPAGTPAAASASPAKKGYNKFLLGCGIALALVLGSCVAGMVAIMKSPQFKKQMAEDEARREKERQESEARQKQDGVLARKMMAALRNNFPAPNSRREMTCPIGEVEKVVSEDAGESKHSTQAWYVDRDFLARFTPEAPPAGGKPPGWDWLTSAGLRDWNGDYGYTVVTLNDLKHSYIVVILNQGLRTPQLRDEDFLGGDFRGWAVLFDSDTLAVLGQTEIHLQSSNKVKYERGRFTQNREGMQKSVDEDFRDQFKDGLKQAMGRMCPKLSVYPSIP